MRGFLIAAALAAGFTGLSAPAMAAESETPPAHSWSFSGPFGTFDRAAAQRGYQVYREVCASCHSMKYVAFRNMRDLGFSEAEVRALAAEFQVVDGPDDAGEMFERPGLPSDRFPPPFPNERAAAAANGGALPVDLSLVAKARAHGPDYLHALLVGYEEPPAGQTVSAGLYYNRYFPGNQIAMPPPLSEGGVEYADGTEATVEQMAHDVATFMTWAAEPKMEERKRLGLKVMGFLLVLIGLFYAVKRRVWADIH